MRLIQTVAEMKTFAREAHARGRSLALVPTMGALHEGHLTLVRKARRQADVSIISIFVNPAQFGASEDLARYPRNRDQDLDYLKPFGVDVVFAPPDSEMYPEGFRSFIEPGQIAVRLEGASRPGHFRGVVTVVAKLLNIVRPDVVYFGQKDFQQVQVVRRLVEELEFDVRMVVCPIVREADGLALSSRNALLGPEERQAALVLSRSLRRAEELAHAGETAAARLLEEIHAVFAAEPRAQLDYAEIVRASDLEPVERVSGGSVALVAARVGSTRLIDNLIFGPPGASPELLLQLALTSQPQVDTGARVPGFETEALRLKILNCRECAAISTILLPPREFLMKYVKQYYPDLNVVRVAVIGRDSPMNADRFLYRNPADWNRFYAGLYDLVGVKSFDEFRARFILTDAIRCHVTSTRISERPLANCVRHLREELKIFPNLDTLVILGEDAYQQFQQFILDRQPARIKAFEQFLEGQGWVQESLSLPLLGDRPVRVFYCHHPTYGYRRSPSIAHLLV